MEKKPTHALTSCGEGKAESLALGAPTRLKSGPWRPSCVPPSVVEAGLQGEEQDVRALPANLIYAPLGPKGRGRLQTMKARKADLLTPCLPLNSDEPHRGHLIALAYRGLPNVPPDVRKWGTGLNPMH